MNALANAILDGNEISTKKAAGNTVRTAYRAASNDCFCRSRLARHCHSARTTFEGSAIPPFAVLWHVVWRNSSMSLADGSCSRRGARVPFCIFSKPLDKFKQVFFILVQLNSVTIIYDRTSGTIGFMDPHEHDDSCGQPRHRQVVATNLLHLGAIIAYAPFTDLDHFVAWLAS